MKVDDLIVEINGRPAAEFDLDEFGDLMRSKEGEIVTLRVRRYKESAEYKIKLTSLI